MVDLAWPWLGELSELSSSVLSESTVSLDSGLELVLVDVTGAILVDVLEHLFDLLLHLIPLGVVLLLNSVEPVLNLSPGDGSGLVGVEHSEEILPLWTTLGFELGELSELLSGILSESTVGFHGGLEFSLVDITGSIGVNVLEHFLELLLHVVPHFVVLFLNRVEPVLDSPQEIVPDWSESSIARRSSHCGAPPC